MHLLQHFHTLTKEPKNAKELKGLILQLAVQGKLTAQWRAENPDQEPATELLKRIAKEKAELVEAKKIRKEKPLLAISEEEKPYELPESWVWCRLGESVLNTTGGGTPSKRNPLFWGGEIPWASVKDFRQGKYLENTVDKITIEAVEGSSTNIIPKGNILVCTRMGLGKITFNRIDVAINQDLRALFFSRDISQNYFYFLYKTLKIEGSGVTVNGIKLNELLEYTIPLPPLSEQKAIVEVVETLFKEGERLEELTARRVVLRENFVKSALAELAEDAPKAWAFLQPHFAAFFTQPKTIGQLREAVLQLAVQGKLTTQWRAENPDQEPATQLLKRIAKEKAELVKEKKIRKEKPLPAISEEEKPYELPESWVWCRLGEISDIIAGGSFKSGDFNNEGGTKCIKITNAGVREFVETEDYLPASFREEYPAYLVKEGDLILALTRPYIKDGLKISVCPKNYHNSLLNQRVAAIRSLTLNVFHPYIFTFIQSPKILNYYKDKFDGKSQQPNMKMGDITELNFSLPPLPEQKAIVAQVDALMSFCDSLEQLVGKQALLSERLMQSAVREVLA